MEWYDSLFDLAGQYFAATGTGNQFVNGGTVPPIVIDQGQPVRCKRRRRRRLLTDGDFNDLMRIATLPNKDIVKIALAKAIGRR